MSDDAGVMPLEEVRRRFPALARTHEGLPVAYFDGPGGTQVPRQVVDAVTDYLLRHNANTHWPYPTSAETDAVIAAGRHAIADFVGGSADEVAFGSNMTTLTFHVSRALGRAWSAGDEIVLTELDHHANIDPWRALERDRGVTIHVARLRPEDGTLDLVHLAGLLGSRTKLVAIGAASNALGTVNDIRRVADLSHEAGALLYVDAVHYAPHVRTDVRQLDCDFLACSAYKFYGPHIGVLWARRAILDRLDVPKLEPSPDASPERVETGTQNHEGIAGAAAAVDFLAAVGGGSGRRQALARAFAALHERGQALVERLWTGLSGIGGVTMYGPPPDATRTPTVAFTVAGLTADEAAARLAQRAVFVSSGHFYALTVARRLGRERDGLVRAGCACYTSGEEVDRLIDGVRAIAGHR